MGNWILLVNKLGMFQVSQSLEILISQDDQDHILSMTDNSFENWSGPYSPKVLHIVQENY